MNRNNLTLVFFAVFVIAAFLTACSSDDKNISRISSSIQSSFVIPEDQLKTYAHNQWKLYSYDKWNLSFQYPPSSSVTIINKDTKYETLSLNYAGIEQKYDHLYGMDVTSYYDPDNSSLGTDVKKWILKEEGLMMFDSIEPPRLISGEKAFHGVFAAGTGGARQDLFYVLKGKRLYKFTFLDLTNRDIVDVDLETRVLDSIRLH